MCRRSLGPLQPGRTELLDGNNGFAIFVVFFGIALIDAVVGGRRATAGIWGLTGIAFALTERKG